MALEKAEVQIRRVKCLTPGLCLQGVAMLYSVLSTSA